MNIKGIFATRSCGAQFLLLFVCLIAGASIALACSSLLGLSANAGAQSVSTMRQLQAVSSLGSFLLPALAMAFFCSSNMSKYLSLRPVGTRAAWPLTLLCMLLLSPFISLLTFANESLQLPEALAPLERWMQAQEALAKQLTDQLLASDRIDILLANLLVVAVIAALTEELFFRGALQRILGKALSNPHAIIWTAAALFSAFHMQFYGFLPRMILGAYFGYLLLWSRSIWLPVFAHFINNATAVVVLSNSRLKEINILTGSIASDELLPYALLAVCSTGLFVWANYLLRRKLLQ